MSKGNTNSELFQLSLVFIAWFVLLELRIRRRLAELVIARANSDLDGGRAIRNSEHTRRVGLRFLRPEDFVGFNQRKDF